LTRFEAHTVLTIEFKQVSQATAFFFCVYVFVCAGLTENSTAELVREARKTFRFAASDSSMVSSIIQYSASPIGQAAGQQGQKLSLINLVDLAGSEKARLDALKWDIGKRRQER